MTSNKWRGHPIEFIGDVWVYSDTKETVASFKDRPCGFCKLKNTTEGHDGCLGTLKGLMNACCGHGEVNSAYIQFPDGQTIAGRHALSAIELIK